MTKLYPLYFATILIYWTVTPTLHAGPLWNVYKDNVEECNSTWWRSLLMIDNWFVDGCFNYSWYVQVEFQFALLLSFLFIIYGKSRPTALGILYSLLFTSFVFFFVFSGKLPSSI
jgi:peptidoglycan/LPS O-acetylase OafA/YrhL